MESKSCVCSCLSPMTRIDHAASEGERTFLEILDTSR